MSGNQSQIAVPPKAFTCMPCARSGIWASNVNESPYISVRFGGAAHPVRTDESRPRPASSAADLADSVSHLATTPIRGDDASVPGPVRTRLVSVHRPNPQGVASGQLPLAAGQAVTPA